MRWLIKNGSRLNAQGTLEKIDVRIRGGYIAEIDRELKQTQNEQLLDAQGKIIAPGFVDLHVHLREPGGEDKETIASGTKAAAAGGFTTVAAMPNTRPVPDHAEHLQMLKERISETAHVRVLPYASITVREAGKELTDFSALVKEGAFAFTDDGVGVQSAGQMLEAMKNAATLNRAIVAHCEDNSLTNQGSVHDGSFASRHNLNGIPAVAESVHIARDVLLAEAANCHYHVCHVSTKESVRVIRDAKEAGIHVTAEVTPHHLLLCDTDIPGLDANYKMNPPLRSAQDRAALIEGLQDGTIDFIATDHAPHTEQEKSVSLQGAPFGIVGLETAFPLLYTHLVLKEVITLNQLIDFLTIKPADAFRLPYGRLAVGERADLVVLDIDEEADINPDLFLSKGKNTPFSGWRCKGWPTATFAEGKLVWEKEGVCY